MKKIIGVIGETGAGKDAFSFYVKKNFDSVLLLNFSQPLSEALNLFLDEIKKQDQQWLVNNLRDRFGEDILAKAIAKKVNKAREDIVVLTGIRVKEDFSLVKDLDGIVVYVTADPEKRWKRVIKRGEKKDDNVSYEKFKEIDSQRPERQIRELGALADVEIENNGTIKELEKKVIETIR